MSKNISNISSGLYYKEVDLTVIKESVGLFAGGSIGLTEKGAAFESIGVSDFDEYTLRFGGLNKDFRTSYFANEFLKQADNYKVVRILGLEGYDESPIMQGAENVGGTHEGFVIAYDDNSSGVDSAGVQFRVTDVSNGSPVQITLEGDQTSYLSEENTIILYGIEGTGVVANGEFRIENVATSGTPTVTTFDLTEFDGTGIDGTGSTYTGGGWAKSRTPFIIPDDTESIAAILKPRRPTFTQYKSVSHVEVTQVTQSDGTTGATDELFGLIIYFNGNQSSYPPMVLKASLRESSNQYIGKLFGYDPRKNVKIGSMVAPLWVDYVFPSKMSYINLGSGEHYYYPNGTTEESLLNIAKGTINFSDEYKYPLILLDSVTSASPAVFTSAGTPAISHNLNVGDKVQISGVSDGSTSLDGYYYVNTVPSTTTFTLNDENGVVLNITSAVLSNASVRHISESNWEGEVLNLGGTGHEIEYQTPITPWFVSDFDENGNTKNLFRFWSISDGEAANTEIKIYVRNLDPSGNLNKGSFDIVVVKWDSEEDKEINVLESFSNLTMDKSSNNYIVKRIGNGEDFPILSTFIFVELNDTEEIEDYAMPYGVKGYPNLSGMVMPDIRWALEYDLENSISKQILGLPYNNINSYKEVVKDNLSFKNTSSASDYVGKGFHLNPQMITLADNPTLYGIVSQGFKIASAESYNISTTNTLKVTGTEKVSRSKFAVDFYGGFDGWNVYSQRDWNTPTSKDYEALEMGIEMLSDNEDLNKDFSVLVTPDINFETHPVATRKALDMVKKRGDALYLFDFNYNYGLNASPTINASSAATALGSSNMLDSYASVGYPDVLLKDETNNVNVWIQPSCITNSTIAHTAMNENVFQPPAGALRTVSENIVKTRKRMKLDDRDILAKAHINPITEFPGSGFEITESFTTQPYFSALSFIHNRLLLGYAKKALNQTLRYLLHNLITGDLKDNLLHTITPIFDRIKSMNGVEKFEVEIKEDSHDRTTLYGGITIYPLYPLRKIVVTFTLKNGEITYE